MSNRLQMSHSHQKEPHRLIFSICCSELLQIKDLLENIEGHLSLHQTHGLVVKADGS